MADKQLSNRDLSIDMFNFLVNERHFCLQQINRRTQRFAQGTEINFFVICVFSLRLDPSNYVNHLS